MNFLINIRKVNATAIKTLCLTIFIMVSNFFIENVRYPLFDDIDLFAWFNNFTEGDSQDDFPWEDVVCVNVGLDKTLAEVQDVMGDKAGVISITDRKLLLQYLMTIADADYKEVFLDVRFITKAEGFTSADYDVITDKNVDKQLLSTIAKMRNIVVSTHSDMSAEDSDLSPKYGMSDYGATVFTDFGRYEIRQNHQPSAALKIYQDLTGKDVSESGYFTDDNKLCHNTLFLKIPNSLVYPTHMDNGAEVVNYRLLGNELLCRNTAVELREMVKGRTVIIGDFEEDLHTTYVGEVPGAMLTYLASQELVEGRHKVGWVEGTLFLSLAFMIYIRMKKPWLHVKITRCRWIAILKRRNALTFLLSLAGWGMAMTLLKLMVWSIFSYSFPTLLPTLLFTIFDEYERYKA